MYAHERSIHIDAKEGKLEEQLRVSLLSKKERRNAKCPLFVCVRPYLMVGAALREGVTDGLELGWPLGMDDGLLEGLLLG